MPVFIIIGVYLLAFRAGRKAGYEEGAIQESETAFQDGFHEGCIHAYRDASRLVVHALRGERPGGTVVIARRGAEG